MNRIFSAACAGIFLIGWLVPSSPLPTLPAGALLGEQLKRQDEQLIGQRFRTLLDFEHEADAVFVRGGISNVTSVAAHTGVQSLRVEGNSAVILVDPLLYGKTISSDWTLLGAYLRLAGTGRVSTSLLADDKVIAQTERDTTADIWLFAAVDLSDENVSKQLQSAKHVQLRIDTPSLGFLMDDVLLVNNRRPLVSATLEEFPKWSVEQNGLSITVNADGRFVRSIASTLASPDGWADDEANPIRARFSGGGSIHKTWTIYADGRSIEDGKLSLLGGAPQAMLAAHERPGEIVVDEATGRPDRETPGDANNDGYNEIRGAYQIIANGPRVAWKVIPQADAPMVSPVFELKHVPGDAFSAMVEGRLFRTACRANADTVLLVLPITIDRPTEIVFKASANQAAAGSKSKE